MGFLERINEWGYALSQALQGQLETGSVAAIFVVFAAGVLTSFTPCVYPMIPVTVTFIGGAAAGSRRRAVTLSVVYVLGLAAVYASLGVITALLGRTFGTISQAWWINAVVGLLIGGFGLAMLDVFTIQMPSFFGGMQSKGVQRGGHFGAVLMGVAAGFIAAPCTAPVLGVLLVYVAKQRDVTWGGFLLLIFSLGLGLLLMLLGIFSGLLSSLPKAGPWMVRLKKGFGIVMLLIAAFFLWQAVNGLLH